MWFRSQRCSQHVSNTTVFLNHFRSAHLIQLLCDENVWLLIGSGVLEAQQQPQHRLLLGRTKYSFPSLLSYLYYYNGWCSYWIWPHHTECGPLTENKVNCNSNAIQKPMLGPAANAPFQTDSSLDPAWCQQQQISLMRSSQGHRYGYEERSPTHLLFKPSIWKL